MNLDSLTRLIQAADFLTFRELAVVCLTIKGYREVTLTDGWSDGGTDLRIFQMPPTPTSLAFQITVEWNWKGKLRADARKVKNLLELNHLILISSRRIAEAEFQEISDEILREYGVHTTRIDSQGIASTFFRASKTLQALKILGIDLSINNQISENFSTRDSAAWSFVFFGVDSHNFREAIIESAIIERLSQLKTENRNTLQKQTAIILRLKTNQETLVASTIDRMLQRGDLQAINGNLSLKPEIADTAAGMKLLHKADWQQLTEQIETFINAQSRRKISPADLDALCNDIGSLLIEAADATSSSFGPGIQTIAKNEAIRNRVRGLHSTLDTLGFPEGKTRDTALEELTELVSNHPFGKRLLMGELYLAISSVETPQLIRAFGARIAVHVLLDSSVAIPVLCSLLFRPLRKHSSVSGHQAYNQIIEHGFDCILPRDYLEEIAGHLIEAYRSYHSIIDIDPDLRLSENAFVAHYAGLKYEGSYQSSFEDYLNTFGLDENLRRSDFYHSIDLLKPRIERLFGRYRVKPAPLGDPSQSSFKKAEEDISHAIQRNNIRRAPILIKHDVRTLAFLYEQDRYPDRAWVLCTWDRLHVLARDAGAAQWIAANPAALADLLSLAGPADAETAPLVSTQVFALMLTEEATELGAAVWDTLAKIDNNILHDAQLISLAQDFKRDYLRRVREGQQAQNIEKEWERWKSRHSLT